MAATKKPDMPDQVSIALGFHAAYISQLFVFYIYLRDHSIFGVAP